MDSKNHLENTDKDVLNAGSESTGVTTGDESIISVESPGIESTGNKLKKVGVGTSNKKRLFADSRLRLFAMAGTVIFGGLAFAVYSPFSSDETIQKVDGEVDIATPQAPEGGTNVIPKEYAEYERAKQAALAEKANANGESYLPQFKRIADDSDQNGLTDQQFITGPNGQSIGKPMGESNNSDLSLSLELDRMANAKMASNNASAQGLGQGYAQGQDQGQQQQQQYQPKYSQQFGNAAGATQEINNHYATQRANYEAGNQIMSEASANAFQEQLVALSGGEKQKNSGYNSVNYPKYIAPVENKNVGPVNPTVISQNQPTIIKAGTGMKARLDNSINTDKGSDVFATVIGGKFNGAKLIGSLAQAKADIQFDIKRMIFKDVEYQVSIRSFTLGNKQSGMADSVQKHTAQRVGNLALATVFEGYGEAYSNLGETVVNGNNVVISKSEPNNKEIAGRIAGNLGTEFTSIARNNMSRPTTYLVNAGKVFEIFFDADVKAPVHKN